MSRDVQQEIKSLVTDNKVVLFMKGSPDLPQCGFSATAAQILKVCGLEEYKSINVLEDFDIREGIKQYSNWPTIPQLYLQGEFVGGCDIMREMYEAGELQDSIKNLNN